jgi:hypothetical protein
MHRAILTAALSLAIGSTLGCSKKATGDGGCGGNDACGAGQVCNDDICRTLCTTDAQCQTDETCINELCVLSSQPRPTMTFIDGDGSNTCADTPGHHCLHAGLVVEGTHLLDSTFKLTPTNPTGSPFALTVRSGASDLKVQLDLPDVPAGDYLLTATNSSGSADQALTFLQGEPGQDGANFTPTGNELVASINTATNLINAARLPVGNVADTVAAGIHTHPDLPLTGGTLSGDLTVNTNVSVNGALNLLGVYKVGDAAPTTYTYSPRRYVVDAPPSKVGVVVPLDQTLVSALCKTIDGCMLTVAMINWNGTGVIGSRHERLFLSTTSNVWRLSNDTDGVDDNGGTQEWSPWDCSFTDAETSTGSGNQRADNGPGFGLLNQAGGGYNDIDTTCRVIIEN